MILPKDVNDVIDTIESANYQAWAVGGCVRDSLLGKAPKDYDIASSCPPAEISKLFPRCIHTGEAYGTVTVLTPSLPVEVTVFRRESEYNDSRHPDSVVPAESIEADLSRRDFTINAMAWHPKRGLCDPFGGQNDLIRKTVRAVGDPFVRFREDALRILRCLRFASVLDFDIDPATLEAVTSLAPALCSISAERINIELRGLLTGLRPELAELAIKPGGLAHFGFTHLSHPEILRQVPAWFILRLTALLYLSDIVSPAENRKAVLHHLRMDHRTITGVMCLFSAMELSLPSDIVSLKRRFETIPPDQWEGLLKLREILLGEDTKQVRALLLQSAGHPWNRSMLAVNGNDMAALGYRGKSTGRILDVLLEKVLQNPELNNRQSLKKIAWELYNTVQNDKSSVSDKK